VSAIVDYETGEMTFADMLDLFSGLVKSGTAWQLQGHYGRMATRLMQAGFLTETGDITEYGHEMADES
jgi:hypothetical protein